MLGGGERVELNAPVCRTIIMLKWLIPFASDVLSGVAMCEICHGSTGGIELAASKIAFSDVLGDASLLSLRLTTRWSKG